MKFYSYYSNSVSAIVNCYYLCKEGSKSNYIYDEILCTQLSHVKSHVKCTCVTCSMTWLSDTVNKFLHFAIFDDVK